MRSCKMSRCSFASSLAAFAFSLANGSAPPARETSERVRFNWSRRNANATPFLKYVLFPMRFPLHSVPAFMPSEEAW